MTAAIELTAVEISEARSSLENGSGASGLLKLCLGHSSSPMRSGARCSYKSCFTHEGPATLYVSQKRP